MSDGRFAGRALTLAELIGGGEEPFRPIELKGIKKGGGSGVVFIKHLSAAEVLDFAQSTQQLEDGKAVGSEEIQRRATKQMVKLIGLALVDEEGRLLLEKPEDAERLPMTAFNQLIAEFNEMTGMKALKEAVGKGSTETPPSDSPSA